MKFSHAYKGIFLALSMAQGANAFAPQTFLHKHTTISSTHTHLQLAKKNKGFGKQKAPSKPKQSPPVEPSSPIASSTTTAQPESTTEFAASPGADALSRLRRQKVEERNEELRQIRDLKSVDQQLQTAPNSAVIPEKVAQRMGKRMLPFVGVPLFGVMGAFITFWYLATYKNYEFQPALVAFSTIGILGAGLIGITYSIISASWDDDVEGSVLGFEEFKTNFNSIKGGLKRTRENAILREKMAGVPEAEIEQAIANLDRKEEAERRREMDLKEKLAKDLE
jgi:hypothetical protein